MVELTGGQEGYGGSRRLAGRYDVGKALILFFTNLYVMLLCLSIRAIKKLILKILKTASYLFQQNFRELTFFIY